jgi:hypothetical protein
MEFWIVLWKIVFVAAIGVFSILFVIVTLASTSGIERLMERRKQQEGEHESDG